MNRGWPELTWTRREPRSWHPCSLQGCVGVQTSQLGPADPSPACVPEPRSLPRKETGSAWCPAARAGLWELAPGQLPCRAGNGFPAAAGLPARGAGEAGSAGVSTWHVVGDGRRLPLAPGPRAALLCAPDSPRPFAAQVLGPFLLQVHRLGVQVL